MDSAEKFCGWAIVEVMGHKKLAGFVSEQTIAGSALVRVDVPATEPIGEHDAQPETAPYTKLIGVASIYMLTPTTEDVARRAARVIERWNDPIPVTLPTQRLLPPPPTTPDDDIPADFFDEDADADEAFTDAYDGEG